MYMMRYVYRSCSMINYARNKIALHTFLKLLKADNDVFDNKFS